MEIRPTKSYGIVSTDIRDINNREMQQMHELKNSIKDVLDSHKPDSKEKKYINEVKSYKNHHDLLQRCRYF